MATADDEKQTSLVELLFSDATIDEIDFSAYSTQFLEIAEIKSFLSKQDNLDYNKILSKSKAKRQDANAIMGLTKQVAYDHKFVCNLESNPSNKWITQHPQYSDSLFNLVMTRWNKRKHEKIMEWQKDELLNQMFKQIDILKDRVFTSEFSTYELVDFIVRALNCIFASEQLEAYECLVNQSVASLTPEVVVVRTEKGGSKKVVLVLDVKSPDHLKQLTVNPKLIQNYVTETYNKQTVLYEKSVTNENENKNENDMKKQSKNVATITKNGSKCDMSIEEWMSLRTIFKANYYNIRTKCVVVFTDFNFHLAGMESHSIKNCFSWQMVSDISLIGFLFTYLKAMDPTGETSLDVDRNQMGSRQQESSLSFTESNLLIVQG